MTPQTTLSELRSKDVKRRRYGLEFMTASHQLGGFMHAIAQLLRAVAASAFVESLLATTGSVTKRSEGSFHLPRNV